MGEPAKKGLRMPPRALGRSRGGGDASLRASALRCHDNLMNTWGKGKKKEPELTHVLPDDAFGVAVDVAISTFRAQMAAQNRSQCITEERENQLMDIITSVLESVLPDATEEVEDEIPDPEIVRQREKERLELAIQKRKEKEEKAKEEERAKAEAAVKAKEEVAAVAAESDEPSGDAEAADEKPKKKKEISSYEEVKKPPDTRTYIEAGRHKSVEDVRAALLSVGASSDSAKEPATGSPSDTKSDSKSDVKAEKGTEKGEKDSDKSGEVKEKKKKKDKKEKDGEGKKKKRDSAKKKKDKKDDEGSSITMSEDTKKKDDDKDKKTERAGAMKRANSGRNRQRLLKSSNSEALAERRKRLQQATAPIPIVNIKETLVSIQKITDAIKAAVEEAFPKDGVTATDPDDGVDSLGFDCYHCSLRGPRPQNEDHYTVVEHCNRIIGCEDNDKPIAFFGMYDGHNGQHGAVYSRVQLHHHISKHEDFRSNMDKAIFDGFLETDKRVNEFQSRKSFSCGTTAICVWKIGNELIVGNTGDSQGILARGGKAVELSYSHSPQREDEKKRLAEAGATVVWFGTWRVNGVLAVSRSIGDNDLRSAVVADPDVTRFQLTDEDEFFILASDGLWDVMKFDESVSFVNDVVKEKGRSACALELCEEAIRRTSKDNVSVIVVFFCKNSE